jgi:hypothetical protein
MLTESQIQLLSNSFQVQLWNLRGKRVVSNFYDLYSGDASPFSQLSLECQVVQHAATSCVLKVQINSTVIQKIARANKEEFKTCTLAY